MQIPFFTTMTASTSMFSSATTPDSTDAVEWDKLTHGDYLFITIFSVVIGAATVFAVQKLCEGLLMTYRGFAKLIDFLHKTYQLLWDGVMFVLKFTIFIVVFGVIFYFIATEEQKRLAFEWSQKTAPTVKFVANKAADGFAVAKMWHRHWNKQAFGIAQNVAEAMQ